METKSGIPLSVTLMQRLRRGIEEAAQEMESQGLMVLGEADTFVPKDTGALVSSGYVEPHRAEGSSIVVDFGYGRDDVLNPDHGRPTSSYALDQHENEEWSHKPPTKAHYLGDVFEKSKPRILGAMRTALMRGLRS